MEKRDNTLLGISCGVIFATTGIALAWFAYSGWEEMNFEWGKAYSWQRRDFNVYLWFFIMGVISLLVSLLCFVGIVLERHKIFGESVE